MTSFINAAKRKYAIWKMAFAALPILFFVILFASAPTQAAAQNSMGFAVSPPTFEMSANPGDTITQSIRVDNLTDITLALHADVKDFVPTGEEGQASTTDKRTNYSLSSWVSVSSPIFDIPARASKTIQFTVAVPQHAEPGGHFGSVVFSTKPTPQQNMSGTAVGQEIGSLLLLKVAGQVTEKAEIASFSPTQDFWQHGPIAFDIRIKNSGNVQLKPTGTITINNIFGEKVASVPIDSKTILPDSTRKIAASWAGSAWPGWYTATASVSYGSGDQILTSTARFVIFPFNVVAPILLILGIAGFLIYRVRHRIVRAVRILIGKE